MKNRRIFEKHGNLLPNYCNFNDALHKNKSLYLEVNIVFKDYLRKYCCFLLYKNEVILEKLKYLICLIFTISGNSVYRSKYLILENNYFLILRFFP